MKKLKNEKLSGFSLIEIIISVAVLGLISIGVSSSFLQMAQNQKSLQNRSDANIIENNLIGFLKSKNFCEANLKGRNIRTGIPRPFVIIDENRVISSDGNLRVNDDLVDGLPLSRTKISAKVLLESLDFLLSNERNSLFYNRTQAFSQIFEVKFNLKLNAGQKNAVSLPVQSTILKVITNRSGVIIGCEDDMSNANQCAEVGGIMINGICEINPDNCTSQGTFITWECRGVRPLHPNVCGSNVISRLRGTTPGSQVIRNSQTAGGYTNPVTKRLACTNGYIKQRTGFDNHNYTLDAGKKKTYTVEQVTSFFTCMKCNN